MANKLAGITLPIGGDTTELVTALKEPGKVTKQLKSQLTDLNKALKLDPDNIELLTAKEKVLNEAVESSAKELDLAKQALKHFVDEGGDLGSAKYSALQGKITDLTRSYDRLKSQQDAMGDSLSNAIKKTETETTKLKSQLEQVNKALKLDPNNVELVEQRERLLEQAIESTKTELEQLTQKQEEFKASGEDIDGEEYTKLQGKIADVKNDLNDLMEQASGSSSIANAFSTVGSVMTSTGDAIQSAGKALTPVSAAAGAVMGASVKAFTEIDKMNDAVTAGTGASGQALKDLQESAKNVFSEFPEDAETVGKALADINTHFGLTGTELEERTKQFLEFAKVNGTDVSNSIEQVQLAMSAADMAPEQLTDVLDQLTYASQNSGVSVDNLASSFSKYGVQMQALGYGFSDTISMLANFEKKGVDSQTVLQGMRTAFNNCAKAGEDGQVALQNFFQGVEDGSANEASAVELFGTRAGGAIFELAESGKLNYRDFMNSVVDANGQLASSYDEMAGPQEEMQVAMNNLNVAGGELGGVLAETLTPFIKDLSDKIREFSEWFQGLDKDTQGWIVTIGGILTIGAPVLLIIGKLVSTIGMLSSGIGTAIGWVSNLTGVLGGIGGSISLGPILAVIGAIAGIGLAVMDLWNNNEDFRKAITETWNKICKVFTDFCDTFMKYWDQLCEIVGNIWHEFTELFAPVLEVAFNTVADVLQGILDIITGIFKAFMSLITGDWQGFLDGMSQAFSGAWNAIWSFLSNMLPAIWNFICGIFSNITNWLTDNWNNIASFAGQAWQWVCDAITGGLQAAWDWCVNVFSGIGQWFSDLWNGIVKGAQDGWQWVCDAITGGLQSAWDWCTGVFAGIGDWFSDLWNGVLDGAKNGWDNIKNAITDALQGAWDFIEDLFGGIGQWFQDRFNDLLGVFDGFVKGVQGIWNWATGWITGGDTQTTRGAERVSWNAKAMDYGIIYDRPTIFGRDKTGRLLGAGELGSEVVVGTGSLLSMIGQTVAEQMAMRRVEEDRIDYNKMALAFAGALQGVSIQNEVYVSSSKMSNALINDIDRLQYKKSARR